MQAFLRRIVLLPVLGAVVLAGCASVVVQSADRRSGERPGIPFYMLRPYMALKKEIPVAGDAGYVAGRVVQGKRTILLMDPPEELLEFLDGNPYVPLGTVGVVADVGAAPGVGAGRAHSGKKNDGADDDVVADAKQGSKTKGALSTATGDVSWDKTVPDSLKIGDIFDVVYLPDLDEKYVVSASGGLGEAELGAAMGPGSTLNKFAMSVDNTTMGQLVADTIAKFTDVGIAALSQPPGLGAGQAHSGERLGADQVEVGEVIALRYAHVLIATPGLYPILKNEEYELAKQQPPLGVSQASHRHADDEFYILKARYPYTRISFNVRRVLTLTTAAGKAPNPARVVPAGSSAMSWNDFSGDVGKHFASDGELETLLGSVFFKTDGEDRVAEFVSITEEADHYLVKMKTPADSDDAQAATEVNRTIKVLLREDVEADQLDQVYANYVKVKVNALE